MDSRLYDVLERYDEEGVKKVSVRESKWIGYRNRSMTFDDILEQAEAIFDKSLEGSAEYPIVVEITPSEGPACESLFTVYREITENQKVSDDSPDIFQSEWPDFPVYIKRFTVVSMTQDEFMNQTRNLIGSLSKLHLNYTPDTYYWIVHEPSLEDDNNTSVAEIWIKT
ncbi:unnamed protein product [Schistosoma turkestanicum]|nr:unnamed protein product [Schistosoma turkestanicum]